MLHALDIYRRLIVVQIKSQMQYRVAFLLELSATTINMFTFFIAIALILRRFNNIGGWTLGEIAFLWGLVEISFAIMELIFSGFEPDDFGQLIRRGFFDQLLLRPINITLQVFGSRFYLRRLGRLIQGIVIFIIALNLVEISWTWPKLLYLPIVVISMVCFFGGLFIIGSTITFWTVESIEIINIFTYGGTEMMSYPMHIYQDWLRKFFTYVIPAIFINYYPALYFLNKPDPFNLPTIASFISPIVGIGLLGVSIIIWQFGIKHYHSTGN